MQTISDLFYCAHTKFISDQFNWHYNKSIFTVIETPAFISWSAKVWSDAERVEFINWIAVNTEAGDVIHGSGGMRKVRWTRAGMGTRGGARVIYFTRNEKGQVVLVLVYAKAKFDNISTEVLKAIKEKFDAHQKG